MSYLTKNADRGAFIKIGNTPRYIFQQAKKEMTSEFPKDLEAIIDVVWLMKTTLRKLSAKEFADLKSHGYWTAKATFESWLSPQVYLCS
jgi:hypothetical protein